jgi:hypothetical protein
VPDAFHRGRQRSGELQAAFAIALQQMQRHALRRLRTHTGQAAKGVDQLPEQ